MKFMNSDIALYKFPLNNCNYRDFVSQKRSIFFRCIIVSSMTYLYYIIEMLQKN